MSDWFICIYIVFSDTSATSDVPYLLMLVLLLASLQLLTTPAVAGIFLLNTFVLFLLSLLMSTCLCHCSNCEFLLQLLSLMLLASLSMLLATLLLLTSLLIWQPCCC